jgi:hypothetical protein
VSPMPEPGCGPVHMDRSPRAKLQYLFVEVALMPSGALCSTVHRNRTRERAEEARNMINERAHHDPHAVCTDEAVEHAAPLGQPQTAAARIAQLEQAFAVDVECQACMQPGGPHKGRVVCLTPTCPSYMAVVD